MLASLFPLLFLSPIFPELPEHQEPSEAQAPPKLDRALVTLVNETRMRKSVQELCKLGPRMGGTRSGARAAGWLKRWFGQASLTVETLVDDDVWSHEESGWKLTARSTVDGEERTLTFETAWPWGFSPSAKGSAILRLEPARGRALLADRPPRIGPGDPEPAIVLVDGATTLDGQWPVVHALRAGNTNTFPVFGISKPDGEQLRAWLESGSGVELDYQLTSKICRSRPSTVVATLAAREGAPPGFLLFCAHGDSDSGGPGANDNASGVAIILEIATAWSTAIRIGKLPPPPREVRFAVWGTEIASTRKYLRDHIYDDVPVLGVINYDQAGFGSGLEQLNIEPDDVPANRPMIEMLTGLLGEFNGKQGMPERWATNKSLGGTDSYVFSGSELFRERGIPAVTLFTSAWGRPAEHPRTKDMPGESWNDGDVVHVDYDVHYHSAGDVPENTTEKEPWNMGWCARAGFIGAVRWLDSIAADD